LFGKAVIMARQAAEFDAQCDLAALVYGKPDEPDRLLREFVQELTLRGCRVVGLVQTRLGDGGAAVTVLPPGETIPLAQRHGTAVAALLRGRAPPRRIPGFHDPHAQRSGLMAIEISG
jgi:hypothetical protein